MADGYIEELRKLIGHRAIMMPCAGVILYDDEKGVLLQKRKDAEQWAFHGGAIELGETVEEAARRELFEETGLIARKLTHFGVLSGKDEYHVYPNGDETYSIVNVFTCKDFTGKFKLETEEVLELRWFAFDQLPDNLWKNHEAVIRKFSAEKRGEK